MIKENEASKVAAYFKVQIEGKYNMYDPEAIIASGLSEEDYLSIQKNYNQLRQRYDDLYESIEESKLAKLTNRPRKFLTSEKVAFKYYSGYLYGIGDTNKPLNNDDINILKRLILRLEIIVSS